MTSAQANPPQNSVQVCSYIEPLAMQRLEKMNELLIIDQSTQQQ